MKDGHILDKESETQVSADIVEANDYSVEQLRQVLFAGSQILPKSIAVSLLERKSYAEKFDDIRHVLEDEQQDAKTRHAAAMALGRLGTPEAMEILRSKLEIEDRFLQRGVRQALEQAAITRASSEEAGEAEPSEDRGWGQRLAAFRSGAPGLEFSFPTGQQLLPIDLEQALTVEIKPALTGEASQIIEEISLGSAGLRLTRANAVGMRCAGRDLMVLLSDDEPGLKKPAVLAERKAFLGVVAIRFGLESQAWSPKYYVLTQPGKERGEAQILLTTTRGRMIFAGTARIEGERAEFSLHAVVQPGATATEVTGSYDAGVLRLERVLTAQISLKKKQPRPLKRRP